MHTGIDMYIIGCELDGFYPMQVTQLDQHPTRINTTFTRCAKPFLKVSAGMGNKLEPEFNSGQVLEFCKTPTKLDSS